MLISQNVKNLVSGISQQAPILRQPEQLEEQVNGWSTEANGLVKRPPTVFIKRLSQAFGNDNAPLLHFVERDSNLKYFVYFWVNTICVVDIAGCFHTVVMKEDPSYIETDAPQRDLRCVTIGDYTFIVNKKIFVQMSSERSANPYENQGALIHVKQGQYGRTYQIYLDGTLATQHTTPDGSDKEHTKEIDVDFIVNKLAGNLRELGYTVDTGSAWLRIRGVSSVSTKDGFNNQAMYGFTKVAQKFSLLPATAPDGYTLKITGDPNGESSSSYYVAFDASEGVWKECVKPNITIGFEPTTMPHALVRQSDDSFVFQRVDWAKRDIGDEDSNPIPSFVNARISDIAFHRNRLVFLSDENVICSESAEYFNFWQTTASDILDTDPIDVATTTERVNYLNWAVPYNGELYCFSDKSQFVLRADGTLSPKNTALVEVTSFNTSPDCKPVRAGRNLYFPIDRTEYASIKEYYTVQQVSDEKNAQDITSHVPNFIPKGVYQVASNTNENIMLFMTQGDKTSFYVYKYLFVNENRVQSSWSRWDMGERVYGAFFAGSTLFVLINRGGSHCLEKINFTSFDTQDIVGYEPYRVYLDAKKIATSAQYDAYNRSTTFYIGLEYNLDNPNAIKTLGVITPDGDYRQCTVSNGQATLSGNWTGKNVIIGFPYKFHIRLSPIYIRNKDQNGSVTSNLTGRLQVRYIRLNYANTGGFTVDVTYNSGRKCQYVMTARQIGFNSATLGEIPDDTGIFKFPVQTLNTNVQIDITSELPLPISLIGFLWEGSFVARSRGV